MASHQKIRVGGMKFHIPGENEGENISTKHKTMHPYDGDLIKTNPHDSRIRKKKKYYAHVVINIFIKSIRNLIKKYANVVDIKITVICKTSTTRVVTLKLNFSIFFL